MSADTTLIDRIQARSSRLVDSQGFQMTIVGVILLNALVLGLATFDSIDRAWGGTLFLINAICLGIFVVEILIRISAFGARPQDYFRSGWNIFDFVVVFAVVIPGVRENAALLRIVRLLRIFRIVSVLPDLRMLIDGMGRALRPIGALAVLTVIFLFGYGMVGVQLFGEQEPDRWGNIGSAMLTLFTVLTLEGWNDVLFNAQEVTQYGWIFFVSFVLIASFLVINVLLAIIINSIEEAREADRAEAIEERITTASEGEVEDPVAALVARLGEMRRDMEELEIELSAVDQAPRPSTGDGVSPSERQLIGQGDPVASPDSAPG